MPPSTPARARPPRIYAVFTLTGAKGESMDMSFDLPGRRPRRERAPELASLLARAAERQASSATARALVKAKAAPAGSRVGVFDGSAGREGAASFSRTVRDAPPRS